MSIRSFPKGFVISSHSNYVEIRKKHDNRPTDTKTKNTTGLFFLEAMLYNTKGEHTFVFVDAWRGHTS